MSLRSPSVTSPELRWTRSRSPNFSGRARPLLLEAGRQFSLVAPGQSIERQSASDRGLPGSPGPSPVFTRPAVYHYATFEHALELRAELSGGAWLKIVAQLPGAVLVGLAHPLARIVEVRRAGLPLLPPRCRSRDRRSAVSAAGLGWEAKLLESVIDGDLAVLLGVRVQTGVEAEHPDCLLAVFPPGAGFTIDEQRIFLFPARCATSSVVHGGLECRTS